jgi:hypothetical protein
LLFNSCSKLSANLGNDDWRGSPSARLAARRAKHNLPSTQETMFVLVLRYFSRSSENGPCSPGLDRAALRWPAVAPAVVGN